jgi:hypothetical protein
MQGVENMANIFHRIRSKDEKGMFTFKTDENKDNFQLKISLEFRKFLIK